MAEDDIRQSCPICLGAQDPADMVGVLIERVFPQGIVPVALCRKCAYAIAEAVNATGEAAPEEVKDDTAKRDRGRARARESPMRLCIPPSVAHRLPRCGHSPFRVRRQCGGGAGTWGPIRGDLARFGGSRRQHDVRGALCWYPVKPWRLRISRD